MRPTTEQLIIAPDALDLSDPNRPVSSRSRWQDQVWYFDTNQIGAPRLGKSLNWPKDANPDIVEMLRKIAWSALVSPQDRRVSLGTMGNYGFGFDRLARFMTYWNYIDFTEFDRKAVQYLLTQLRKEAATESPDDYDDLDDEDALREEEEAELEPAVADPIGDDDRMFDSRLTFSAVYTIFRTIALIYRQREVARRLGVAIGDEDPLGGKSPYSWATKVRAQCETTAHALPDEIALPMSTATDRLLGTPADDVIDLIRLYLQKISPSRSVLSRQRAEAAVLASGFSTLKGEDGPWHPPLPLRNQRGKAEPISCTLRNLAVAVSNAAVLLLLQLTGLRIGEIVSLRAGVDHLSGLPACVRRVRSASGRLDLFYACGAVTKWREAPDAEWWLIGASPAGSACVPMTVRAIDVLQRLFEHWRLLTDDPLAADSLFLSLSESGLPRRPIGITRPTVTAISNGLNELYGRLLDWNALPDFARDGTDLARYKRTRGRCIKTSQWRKTYAVSTVRINSRLIAPLKRHFKHLKMATTERAYIGADVSMLEDFDEAQIQMTVHFLRDRARGTTTTAGRTAGIIKRNLKWIRLLDEQGDPELGENLEASVRTLGMRLSFTEYGACAIVLDPMSARCHELAGNSSFLNDRPDVEQRSPDVCASCKCFVADSSNIPSWRRRFVERNADKRTLLRAGEIGAARAMALRARRALRILRGLERGMTIEDRRKWREPIGSVMKT
jgi:hypothetical protein